MEGTALKGRLCNPSTATTVGEGADGSTLTDGSYMFYSSGLTSWTVDMQNLTSGDHMFSNCYSLTSFAGDLSSLTNGNYMFSGCYGMTSFSGDLSSLTSGNWMFYSCNLTSFTGDLPNLTNGSDMFYDCRALTSFNSTLPKLESGQEMFVACKLDATSVLNILNSIPTYTSGIHKLHLGNRKNYLDSTDVAELLGTTTPIAGKNYSYKGWSITVTA
ncbi:MAG: DUF285 domain-containing protein [Bacteroidales bacterium]|nr:DUF285 domain-containing protein [Bacteroidales bacterium]